MPDESSVIRNLINIFNEQNPNFNLQPVDGKCTHFGNYELSIYQTVKDEERVICPIATFNALKFIFCEYILEVKSPVMVDTIETVKAFQDIHFIVNYLKQFN